MVKATFQSPDNKVYIRVDIPTVPRVGEFVDIPRIPDAVSSASSVKYRITKVMHVLTFEDARYDGIVYHFVDIILENLSP